MPTVFVTAGSAETSQY